MANANDTDGEIKLNVGLTVKDIQKTARALQKQVAGIFDTADAGKVDSRMKSILGTLSKLTAQSRQLSNQMEKFADERIPTQEYKSAQQQVDKLATKYQYLVEKKKAFLESGGDRKSKAFDNIMTQLGSTETKLEDARERLQNLVDTGRDFTLGKDTEEYQKMGMQLNDLSNKIVIYRTKWEEASGEVVPSLRATGNAAKTASVNIGAMVKNLLRMAGGAVRRGFSFVVSGMRNIHNRLTGINRTSKFSLKNILAYALGIRGLFSLFSKLKSMLQEGINNIVRWNDGTNEANKAVSELTSSLLYLKNTLAAAFTPILTVVAPILSKFIDQLSEAINKLGMFFAYITGKTKYIQAKKVMQDYAKSLGEVNDKLAEYDKLSVINDEDASKDPNNMFEQVEVPITGSIVDWIDKFKEAWKNADFTEIGKTVGEKLKAALENIPWDQIKEVARNIGKSLATFINGFVEVEGLGETIGETIAEAFNTALEFVYGFVHNLHWESVGQFISDAIMGFFTTFDWNLFTDTIAEFVNGLVDLLTTVLEKTDWDSIGQKIGQCFTDLIEKIDWRDIGKLAAEAVNAFFELIQGISDTFDADKLGTAISDAINGAIENIKWEDNSKALSDLVIKLIDAIASAVEKVNWKKLGDSIRTAITNIKWGEVFQSATTLAINLFQALIDLLTGFLEGEPDEFLDVGQDVVDGITAAINKAEVKELGKSLVNLVYRAIYWAAPQWVRDIMDSVRETWKKIKKYIDGEATIEEAGQAMLDGLKEGIKAGLRSRLPWWMVRLYDILVGALKEKFGISSPSTVMEEMGGYLIEGFRIGIENGINAVVQVVEDLGNALLTPFNVILQGVEFMVNGIIDGINWIIDTLNNFRIDIPDTIQTAIEYMGGPSISGFGFNIGRLNHVSLPRLAQGAVIPPNRQFLAMLGDQKSGTNIEAPLDTMVAAFKQALEEDGGSNHQPIVLQLDGRTVAKVVWDETDKKYKQTGQYVPRYA